MTVSQKTNLTDLNTLTSLFEPLLEESFKLDEAEDALSLSIPLMSIPGGIGKAPGLCGRALDPFLVRPPRGIF